MQKVSASKTGGNHKAIAPMSVEGLRRWAMLSFMLLSSMLLPSLAQAGDVTLKVVSARAEANWNDPVTAPATHAIAKGAPIAAYKYIINIDNTGSTATQRSPAPGTGCNPADAGYPDTCKWTSIGGTPGFAPIYTQGDQADFAAPMNIPDGRYLISVLADGFKLDGRHFTVTGNTIAWEGKAASDPATEVKVEMQPWPLPDAQIQAAVFEDISPVNSAPDLPAEHGLAGFQGHIVDYLGEVTTDVYGGPLCDTGRCLSACYVVNNGVDVGVVQPVDKAGRCPSDLPVSVPGQLKPMYACDIGGGKYVAPYMVSTSTSAPYNNFQCPSITAGALVNLDVPAGAAIEGKIRMPNLGPNRYALSVTPPDGSGWVQTTTLEGNHDWDAWVMEGATGLDTEFTIAGEPFPAIIFGFVPKPGTPSADGSVVNTAMTGGSTIKGVVEAVKIYVPTTGGVGGLPGEIWGGMQGAKIDKPIPFPKVTLTDLDNGDTIVWAGEGDADGKFTIPNVPAGTYTLTWWDEPQNTILDLVNVTVGANETVDMGVLPLAGWWTVFEGYVFNDLNRNGVMDPGEPGLPGYTLTMRKRENSLMDRGTTSTVTEPDGYYKFEAAYPMTQWLVMEAYDDLHYSTGITFQADNQPTPTTLLGAGVDVSVHPIIGLSGRLDWGKHVYDATGRNGIDPRNGGIVGTVTYDVTRNELDPRFAAVEDWQPSIPDLTVKLFKPVACTSTNPAECDATGRYALAADGSLATGPLLNTYLTETWHRPTNCVARGVDGMPLVPGTDEKVLANGLDKGCIEAPLMGIQFWGGADPSTGEFPGVEVNGNYGFGDGCFAPNIFDADAGTCTVPGSNPPITDAFAALPAGDYLVKVEIPTDALNRPIYKVTREEDINIGNGDVWVPAVPPSPCVGALHTVDSTGNANFPGGPGTSPYEGMSRPLCDMKLISLSNGKSIAPAFNLYTDVPIPGRHWFIIIDDLNFSSNPQSTTFGEKAGMPFVPVGIYDYTNRLIKTVESDYNGLADVLLPSTNRINCPTPSGVCANLYRYVGNDPGVPGRLNPNYDPSFRTIAAEFEILPGLIVPADLAPTQVGVSIQLPGGQNTQPLQCKIEDTKPQLFAVDRPYVTLPSLTNAAARTFTINGTGFGANGTVFLNDVAVPTSAWSPTAITVVVPAATVPGPKQLRIAAGNGQSTVNGITIHALGTGYNPQLYEVSPASKTADAAIPAARRFIPTEKLPTAADHAIQNALDAAATYVNGGAGRETLVVVYPNDPTLDNPRQNPRGAYYENLIVYSKVRLQGVGPGAPDGSVRGTIIDGGAFPGDSPVATDWYNLINTNPLLSTTDNAGNTVPNWAGNQTIYDGAVISLFLPSNGNRAFPNTNGAPAPLTAAPMIDGFDLRGGDQAGFPGNINAIGGGATGQPAGLVTQGGAIYANAYARNLRITNNVIQNNGGGYGTVRIGSPDIGSNNNDFVTIGFNRIIKNAGTNQAGGIGLFEGANNYAVFGNDICGNFSAEYGGGVSHVGRSNGGSIHDNRIYFNRANDEAGGIMIAGSLSANPNVVSPGAGTGVDIYNNLIEANLANDDGGGVRFLMSGTGAFNVYNNFIVNNISTHEGGGISINDASNVRVYNNTIMGNKTTATAITSNGQPAPAGLSTSMNSDLFQATLPNGSLAYSDPILFNNIFWDNRAGTRTLSNVTGLDATTPDLWDLGIADGPGALSPTNSVIQQASGAGARAYNDVGNLHTDPGVRSTYDVGVTFNTWRNNPAFLGAIMISADLPPSLLGDYHLAASTSPAVNGGAFTKTVGSVTVTAPTNDIDNTARSLNPDIGADEQSDARADLGVTITDGVTQVQRGNALAYTVVVSNSGPDAISGATLNFTVPASLTGASWTCSSGCVATTGTGNTVALNPLSAGASVSLTLNGTVAANATGTIAVTAAIALPSGSVDPNGANNTATDTDTVVLPADLVVTMSATPATNPLTRGTAIAYTITVTNAGPNAVTGATVTDTLPQGVFFGNTAVWTCQAAGAGSSCGTGGLLGFGSINRTVNIGVNGSVTYSLNATLSQTTNALNFTNTASVAPPADRIDPNTSNNQASVLRTIQGYHVGALSATSAATSGTLWSASVTVTAHNANHAAQANVAVQVQWAGGGNGGTQCTTNAQGACTVTRTGLSRANVAAVTATVNNMTGNNNGYQAALNEAGPAITVSRP